MEKDDKGSTMIRMGVSGWMFPLVPAYPGRPGSKAVKRSLLLLLLLLYDIVFIQHCLNMSLITWCLSEFWYTFVVVWLWYMFICPSSGLCCDCDICMQSCCRLSRIRNVRLRCRDVVSRRGHTVTTWHYYEHSRFYNTLFHRSHTLYCALIVLVLWRRWMSGTKPSSL